MSTATNHWKLGVFVVVGTLVGLSAIFFLGARTLREEMVTFHSYFDESVSGLNRGAVVSFRGVRVGNVSVVRVAPDGRHVEVVYTMEASVLDKLGLIGAHEDERAVQVPPDLRVQLSTTSITGGKYLKLDIFEPHAAPPPELPFEPGPNYIPTVPSTLKNLEDALLRAVEELPELAGGLGRILKQTSGILEDIHEKELPARAIQLFDRAEQVMLTMERAVEDLETKELSARVRTTLRSLDQTLVPMREVLAQVRAPDGLIDSMERAADGVGDLTAGTDARGDLVETLRSLRGMAESVQRLADALETDPDMLLKGRAQEKRR